MTDTKSAEADATGVNEEMEFVDALVTMVTKAQSILLLVNGGLVALNVTMLTSPLSDAQAVWRFLISTAFAFFSFYMTALFLVMNAGLSSGLAMAPKLFIDRVEKPIAAGRFAGAHMLVFKSFGYLIFLGLPIASGFLFMSGVNSHATSLRDNLPVTYNEPSEIIFYFSPPAVEPLN